VEEIRVPGENHWSVTSHWQIYHIMLYRVHLAWVEFHSVSSSYSLTSAAFNRDISFCSPWTKILKMDENKIIDCTKNSLRFENGKGIV
jgi:hypothetical protein